MSIRSVRRLASSRTGPAPDRVPDLSPRTARYWQELWVYAWAISLLASWYEIALSLLAHAATGDPRWLRAYDVLAFLTFAEPYGLGTVAVMLLVVPLRDRFRLGPPIVFAAAVLVTGAVEVACALVLVDVLGTNPFWDYSLLPYGDGDITSLASCTVFGVIATLFVFWIHPATAPWLRRLDGRKLRRLCWVLAATFVVAEVVKVARLGWL